MSALKFQLKFVFFCGFLAAASGVHAASYGSATWDEQDNQIQLKTVCANHKYGSISYRECRADVAKYFKRQCDSYAKLYDQASSKNRGRYKTGKNKYCRASRHFRIVN